MSVRARALLVADRCVVDHGIKTPELVRLTRQFARLPQTAEVTSQNGRHPGQLSPGVLGALLVSGMRDHRVPLLQQQLRRHQAEPVGRAGYKYLRREDPRSPS